MKLVQTIVFTCCLSTVIGEHDLSDGRVVGGIKAPEGAAPYQVSLRDEQQRHVCGGSILNESWIITAAHCVAVRSPRHVVAGTNRVDKGGQEYAVKMVVSHPGYARDKHLNDLALVETVHAIAFNDRVRPASLPSEDTPSGRMLTLTGWGRMSYQGIVPNDLQFIRLKTISTEECRSRLSRVNVIFDTQICTLMKPGHGACHGDSGGPLVDRGILVGVVSWGYPCAKGYPDVFTRIWNYRSWISTIVKTQIQD